jgi:streptogramin lyase
VKPATVAGSVVVDFGPQDVAITQSAVYVTGIDGRIAKVDPNPNGGVLAMMDLGDFGNGYPTAIAVGDDGDLWVTVALWDANDHPIPGKLLRVDPASGQVKATIPIGPTALDIAASPGAIWVVNYGDGTIQKVDPTTNTATLIPALAPDGSGIAFGEGSIWVSSEDGQVLRIDPATGNVTTTIPTLPGSEGLAVGSGAVWVAAYGNVGVNNGMLLRIDPATNQVVKAILVGTNPIYVAAGCGTVFVAMDGDSTVAQVDPGSNNVIAHLTMPGTSWGIAADDHTAWAVQQNLPGLKLTPPQPGTVTRMNCAS